MTSWHMWVDADYFHQGSHVLQQFVICHYSGPRWVIDRAMTCVSVCRCVFWTKWPLT